MIFFSKERYAECAALRATYVPCDPVWTATSEGGLRCDFGDYSAVVYFTSFGGGWVYWEVSKKVVNELLGVGRQHVMYGYDGETFERAKVLCAGAVADDRRKTQLRKYDAHAIERWADDGGRQ